MAKSFTMNLRPNGFSLVEMCILATLLGLCILIAIPIYSSAMEVAEQTSAIDDIGSISNAVDTFQLNNGHLPDSLAQIGMLNVRDPWGNFYIYKKLQNTEPLAVDGAKKKEPGTPLFRTNPDGSVSVDVDADGVFDLTAWDLSEETLEKLARMNGRIDQRAKRLNSDYDLYSIGSDRDTDESLDSPACEDDIIRANNGSFVNKADKF